MSASSVCTVKASAHMKRKGWVVCDGVRASGMDNILRKFYLRSNRALAILCFSKRRIFASS